jgi:hypothetical protein
LADVKISPAGIVIGLGFILIAGVFTWLTFGPKPKEAPPPVLTAEAIAYLPKLALDNVRMQAAESVINQRVIEILGDIRNDGDRVVKLAEVKCIFYDYYGKELQRERVVIVSSPLAPGATKPFRLPFDDIPDSWNQALPKLAIAQIQFQ